MSDPVRFRDGGGGDLAQQVVDSVREEAPSTTARRRTELALGLGAAATATTATSSALGTTLKVAGTGLAKWVTIAAVVAVGGGSTVAYVRLTEPSGASRERPAAASAALSSVTAEGQTLPATAPTAIASEGASTSSGAAGPIPPPTPSPQDVGGPPGRTAAETKAGLASSRPAQTLSDELVYLEEAQACLRRGDAAGALGWLNKHDQNIKRPVLSSEVAALRIDSYARLGDHKTAKRLAKQFLSVYGDRPEAQRVQSILDAEPDDDNP